MSNDSPRDGAQAPVPAAEREDARLLLEESRHQFRVMQRQYLDRLESVVAQVKALESWQVDDPLSPFVGAQVIERDDVLSILAAALPHAPSPPTGWQPIETARRVEMLPVFLRINGRGKVGYWHDGKWRSGGPDPVTEPSHWMPIPDYPPLPAPVAPHEDTQK